jgi:CubicO group peptidase (beta-lactamase class C family)
MQFPIQSAPLRFVHSETSTPDESIKLNSQLEALNRTLDSVRISSKSEGLSYAMIDQNGNYYSHSLGYADKANQVKMSDATVLNFASLAKPVTALALLKLHRDSVIDLDQPLNRYLTSWKVASKDYDANQITIRRALNHTAGLSMPSAPFFKLGGPIASPKEVLNGNNKEKKPVFVQYKPGDAWHYSAGGYTALQLLLEDTLRDDFNSCMRGMVFRKLGMKESSFDPKAQQASKAKYYDDDGMVIAPYHAVGSAAGGLYTTVKDFSRFVVELANAYRGKGLIIDRKTVDQVIQGRVKVDLAVFGLKVKDVEYGLGFFVRPVGQDTLLYHSGGNPGARAYFVVSLATGKALIVAANSDNARPPIERLVKEWGQLNNIAVPELF